MSVAKRLLEQFDQVAVEQTTNEEYTSGQFADVFARVAYVAENYNEMDTNDAMKLLLESIILLCEDNEKIAKILSDGTHRGDLGTYITNIKKSAEKERKAHDVDLSDMDTPEYRAKRRAQIAARNFTMDKEDDERARAAKARRDGKPSDFDKNAQDDGEDAASKFASKYKFDSEDDFANLKNIAESLLAKLSA